MITLWIVRHEVQLLLNHYYNKIREEYDSGINYLKGLLHSTSELYAEKEPIQMQLEELDDAYCPITQAWRVQLYNYKRKTCATVQLRLKSGLLMTNQIREFCYSYDYVRLQHWQKNHTKLQNEGDLSWRQTTEERETTYRKSHTCPIVKVPDNFILVTFWAVLLAGLFSPWLSQWETIKTLI